MDEVRTPPFDWGPRRRMRSLKPVWKAAHDGRAAADTLGTWFHDGVVVTAAFDRLRAFDAATGSQTWSWDVPGRNVLSAMSDGVKDGVGLVAHWPDISGGPKTATITALDVVSGKEMWSAGRDLTAMDRGDFVPDVLALTGQRAVVATRSGTVALDARTGRQEWAVDHGSADEVRIRSAADRLVLLTTQDDTAKVGAVDATDGRLRWSRPLPIDGPLKRVRIVAVDPLLVAVEAAGRRGPACLLRLDDEGNITAEIALTGDHGRVVLGDWTVDDRRAQLTVCGDTLLAFVEDPSSGTPKLAGFSLSRARHLWTSDNIGVDAMDFHSGHVMTVHHWNLEIDGQTSLEGEAYVLDPADGRQVARRNLRVTADEPYTVHLHGKRMLWVNKKSSPSTPPLTAYDWR
ncbi:PQQ-binding-like beta-propeller repeat protein [Streptomyces sp. NPDC049040]|uniref:outer membrane protein assembly factor BamB family protein n=1 Tax=Streptomyces sp. NPDC049040 TaxID=3365593 RepID=UPI003717E453